MKVTEIDLLWDQILLFQLLLLVEGAELSYHAGYVKGSSSILLESARTATEQWHQFQRTIFIVALLLFFSLLVLVFWNSTLAL